MYTNIELKNKERYSKEYSISKSKIENALDEALWFLEKNIAKFGDNLVDITSGYNHSVPNGYTLNRYAIADRVKWTNSMWTGMYWLAYMLTDKSMFREMAESHIKHYLKAVHDPTRTDDHDTGFRFIPSCLAAYKITGDTKSRAAALLAAEILLDHYCPVNNFIIRLGQRRPDNNYDDYRTLVDTMMNIPLFFWAYEETGNKEYYDAAVGHYKTTTKYLIREDGSSYHHYQFDPVTFEAVGPRTLQGHRDESCWSRGHSWLLAGFPKAYEHTKDEEIIDIHRAVSYYFMDHLPEDGVPYWDFDFSDGSFEPRDSSASAIATCGLMDMDKYLTEDKEQKVYFRNAANLMLDALIDKCANHDKEADCLLTFVTGSKPHAEVDGCALYGDYFYLEALVRALRPDMKMFW